MTLIELAFALIAVFEGCRLKSYQDSGGVWTIGIGHTEGVTEHTVCTLEQAMQWFKEDFAPLLELLTDKLPVEGAALASFGFNCGRGALRKVLSGLDSVNNPAHTKDRKGIVQPGLVARRRFESALIRASK